MSRLNPEILFGIGKKLIEEDRDLDAVIQFGLSGKETFNVLRNVFASISTVKLYDNQIAIGWNKECLMIDAGKLPKCFLYCIGGCVKNLEIEREINQIFQPILDKIISKKQLHSFSSGNDSYCSNTLKMDKFLPLFSSTLKNLKIPSRALSDTFVDSIYPQTLTLVNFFNLVLTTSVYDSMKHGNSNSQFYSSVKNLSIKDKTYRLFLVSISFKIFIQHFSSLQTLSFNMKYDRHINRDLSALIKMIKKSNSFPSTIVYTVLSNGIFLKNEVASNLEICKDICKDFVYDSSNSIFHCFHQTFQSDVSSQNVAFKVLIPITQKLFWERNQWIY